MANLDFELLVTEAPLETPPVRPGTGTGAAADFWGIVRGTEAEREIEGIDYEVHREMAEHQFRRIAKRARDKFALADIVIHHRIGFVAVGEASLFVRVCSRHRDEAFRAIRWIVDELKKKVPIWKRPRFKDVVAGVVDAAPGSTIPATTNPATV